MQALCGKVSSSSKVLRISTRPSSRAAAEAGRSRPRRENHGISPTISDQTPERTGEARAPHQEGRAPRRTETQRCCWERREVRRGISVEVSPLQGLLPRIEVAHHEYAQAPPPVLRFRIR